MIESFNPVKKAQELITEIFRPGDLSIDATMGNGSDTGFLASAAGEKGYVFAFDIQDSAIRNTESRLDALGMRDRVSLIKANHELMSKHLPSDAFGKIKAIMFNLGYLPGGDKDIITNPDSTISALNQCIQLMHPEGIITVVMYSGHSGGMAECAAIKSWAENINNEYTVAYFLAPIGSQNSPELLVIRK
jgi:predicted methyltransferase